MRRINVGTANVGTLNVQRLATNTGDPKSAESDLLADMKGFMKNTDKTLSAILGHIKGTGAAAGISSDVVKDSEGAVDKLTKSLTSISEDLKMISARMGELGMATEGATHQTHLNLAANRANHQTIHDLDKVLNDLNKTIKDKLYYDIISLDDAFKLFKRGVMTEFGESINTINTQAQHLGRRLTDFGNITRAVTDKFNTYMNLSAAGLVDFKDILIDFFPSILGDRDNLASTFKVVKESMQSGLISPIGHFGETIMDVGKNFRSLRDQFDDRFNFDFFERMGFEEANASIVALYDSQRRANLNASIRDVNIQRNIAGQLKIMDVIAQNTGQTVEELIKMTRKDTRDTANLNAAGIISDFQKQNYDLIIKALRGSGQEATANMLMDVIRQGGSVEAYLGKNQETAQGLAATGNIDVLRRLAALGNQNMSEKDTLSQVGSITRDFGGGPQLGVAGAQVIDPNVQAIIGEAGLARQKWLDGRGADQDTLGGFSRKVMDFFANVFPTQTTMMIAAIAANTVALIANTVALSKGGIGGLFGGLGKGFSKMGKPFAAAGRGIAKGAGMLGGLAGMSNAMDYVPVDSILNGKSLSPFKSGIEAGAKFAGKGMGKGLLKGLLKKIPLLGLGIGGFLAVQRLMDGDILGAGGELLSGAASLFPGLGTAASVAIDTGLAARDAGVFGGSVAPAGMADMATPVNGNVSDMTPPTKVGEDTMLDLIKKQNQTLDDLRDLFQENNNISDVIKQNTAGLRQREAGWFDSVTRAFSGAETKP